MNKITELRNAKIYELMEILVDEKKYLEDNLDMHCETWTVNNGEWMYAVDADAEIDWNTEIKVYKWLDGINNLNTTIAFLTTLIN